MKGKPFIKLFHTPNSAYFLDINKNEIIQIDEATYLYLENEVKGPGKEKDIPEEVVELKKSGYLSTESNVKEICHPYTKFLGVFLERKMGKITLQVTQKCNFRCKYCVYTPKGKHETANAFSEKYELGSSKSSCGFFMESLSR